MKRSTIAVLSTLIVLCVCSVVLAAWPPAFQVAWNAMKGALNDCNEQKAVALWVMAGCSDPVFESLCDFDIQQGDQAKSTGHVSNTAAFNAAIDEDWATGIVWCTIAEGDFGSAETFYESAEDTAWECSCGTHTNWP